MSFPRRVCVAASLSVALLVPISTVHAGDEGSGGNNGNPGTSANGTAGPAGQGPGNPGTSEIGKGPRVWDWDIQGSR